MVLACESYLCRGDPRPRIHRLRTCQQEEHFATAPETAIWYGEIREAGTAHAERLEQCTWQEIGDDRQATTHYAAVGQHQVAHPALAPEAPPPVAGGEGLTVAEAARRLVQFGPNLVKTGGHFRLLRMGLGLLANPLVVILLVASVVSGIVGETLSAAIIVTIVLLSVALDFFQVFQLRAGGEPTPEPGRP